MVYFEVSMTCSEIYTKCFSLQSTSRLSRLLCLLRNEETIINLTGAEKANSNSTHLYDS